MTLTMDLCRVMARVRDLHIDDVKATTIKEKEKENTCLLYEKKTQKFTHTIKIISHPHK